MYDASGYSQLISLAFVAIVIGAACLAIVRDLIRRDRRPPLARVDQSGIDLPSPGQERGVMYAFALFCGILVIGDLLVFANQYSIHDAVSNGDYATIVGRVVQFQPGDWAGREAESFTVRTSDGTLHSYAYRHSLFTIGLSQTQASGGVVVAGKCLSIGDVNGLIGRLAIVDPCE